MNAEMPSLDLFSTSQTKRAFRFGETCASPVLCIYHAPYFAYQKEGRFYGVLQGSCNHWDCPKCGLQRAKYEYGRIVEGVQTLAKSYTIYFYTITCRGSDLSAKDAEENYLKWTNRFLSSARIKAKREGQDWYYVQVTEKQKRGHPHSHILTTFTPGDLYEGYTEKWRQIQGAMVCERIPALRSNWIAKTVTRSGLGSQYDISTVRTAAAASRYVAKYMFKDSMFGTHWPKGWKRVRYSQNFPKLPEKETSAFVLLSSADWGTLAGLASVVITDSPQTKTEVLYRLSGHDILVG